ncbi:SMP-30/gluconolactonase/LRE family protein [Amorphus orientalis]|uniref:Sugar lactone lactonase YvrE n=1 Tax=Amorphus orientalis TaxID=649198 RepID=A0AAE3VKM1_9HYPH|nr:SMP-30/gluconolactonase/LRE family protein [Amorphus orientalis]MDQ0313760.1 sugar lactone lactonase YvrE [Amorphus orientalis]
MNHQSDATVRILFDTPLELGEGPRYDPVTDTAWWFDILGRGLFEHSLQSGRTIRHDLPFMASEIARIDDRRQLVAAEDGLYVRDTTTGGLDLLHPLEADNPGTRSNDGAVHRSGALWIGTMGKGAEPGAGTIYHFLKGELRPLFDAITIPNAIAFTEDGTTAYFSDTPTGRLMRVPVAPETGLPTAAPTVVYDHRDAPGSLDGAVIDRAGTIWIALWGAGRLLTLSPAGEPISTIPVSAAQPSCPATFGRNADRLLVTSAWEGMAPDARAADPHAGKTFVIEDAGFEGFFSPEARQD